MNPVDEVRHRYSLHTKKTQGFSQFEIPPLMKLSLQARLINFLKEELAISGSAIDLALREDVCMPNHIPIALWQYGLVTLEQLDQIFDWLEMA